jgi:hypothetical protein
MTRSSPIKTRRKAAKAKSPFLSPGTKRTKRELDDMIVTKAATELMLMLGDGTRAPYGSMGKILRRFKAYNITRNQVQRRFEKLKMQDQEEQDGGPRRSLFVPPSEQMPASLPPVDEIHTGTSISPQSTLTGTTSSSSARNKGGRPKGTTNVARQENADNTKKAIEEAANGLMTIQWSAGGSEY